MPTPASSVPSVSSVSSPLLSPPPPLSSSRGMPRRPPDVHLAGATASATAFARRVTGFCAPLKPPLSREGGRAEEGRTTSSCQRQRLGRRLPRPPSLFAVTIVALETPPSSSIIAVAISSLGWDTTMHTSVGEEGGALALAPASLVEIEPASATAGGGGTGSSLRLLRGGGGDFPSSSCRRSKDLAAAAAAAAEPAWWRASGEGEWRAQKLCGTINLSMIEIKTFLFLSGILGCDFVRPIAFSKGR